MAIGPDGAKIVEGTPFVSLVGRPPARAARTMTATAAATTMMTSTAKMIDRVPCTPELKMILSMSAADFAPVSSSPRSRASTKASRWAK